MTLHARAPVTRLDAMNDFGKRAEHAASVRATAAAVLAELPDDLRPDTASDRGDLAKLLATIGETWEAALDGPQTHAEQLRWSKVCVLAQRFAGRLQAELDAHDAAVRESRKLRSVLRLPRRT